VGGGVVGDLAGFVAATLHRGVPVVQVPTSLLAMVDASVGGKTGLDTPAGKNLVGAFHDPSLVVADVDVLHTLPESSRRDGLAEMLKHGLIADVEHFSALCGVLPALAGGAGAEVPTLPALVAHSIGIKAAVVHEDARESGRRQVLNAGHTIAHAIEYTLSYAVPHGSAVAAGLVVEARLAELLGVAEPGLGDVVAAAVRRAGLPDAPPPSVADADLLAATRGDKKARGGRVEYALPIGVGRMDPGPRGRWSRAVADEAVLEALARSRALGGGGGVGGGGGGGGGGVGSH
jgi:3-dehydroquinate synthase